MSAEALHHAHTESVHDTETAANNHDHLLSDGGVLPLARDIGKLLFGVVVQAPVDAARKGSAKEADHPHPAHKEKHGHPAKADEKSSQTKHTEEKKEGAAGHGAHGQESAGDWFAVAKSTGAVLEDLMSGKVDKHSVEHAVDHWLDARNLGKARPFAGVISSAAVWGLGKMFKIRDHALEKLEPKWESLGRQIILGLPYDKKHGYHSGVENLCDTMEPSDIEDHFSKFLTDVSFENAMKSNGGQKALQNQLSKWMGNTEQPDSAQVNKRIDAILKILKLEDTPEPGLFDGMMDKVKGFFKSKKPHGHGHDHGHHPEHHHEHALDSKKAEKNRQMLIEILKRVKSKCTDSNLTMIFEGKIVELDLDHLGDKASELASLGDSSRISFVASLRENALKAKFKKLIAKERLASQVKTEKGRIELRALLRSLHDLEEGGTLNSDELDVEFSEYFGPKGVLKEEKDYPKDSVALNHYKMFKGLLEQIHKNLKQENPDNPDQTYLDMIYDDPIVIKYEEFGTQLRGLDAEKSVKYIRAYNSDEFGIAFRLLLSEKALRAATGKEETRKAAQSRVLVFLGLPTGPVDELEVEKIITKWKTKVSGASGNNKHQLWLKDVEDVEKVLTAGGMLKAIFEGPEKPSIYSDFIKALDGDIPTVLSQFQALRFRLNYPLLMKGSDIGDLDGREKVDAKDQAKKLLGLVPTKESQVKDVITAIWTALEPYAPAQGRAVTRITEAKTLEVMNCLQEVMNTLTQENLDKINAA